jgi:uncharacterized protein (TIGR02246 family)
MRTSIHLFTVLVALSFTFFACTGQQAEQLDMEQVRQAIEEADAKWVEAFNQGDAAGVAALYADDATLMPPNNKMIQGKEGVQEYWNGAIQMGLKDVSLTTVDLKGSGDLVYQIGKYSIGIEAEGQEPMRDSGKYIVVWKRQEDGSWKLQADIWNSSMPIPGQEVTEK